MSLGLCLLSWLLVYLSAWFRKTLCGVHAQSSSATVDPLNGFIGSVNSAASIINSPDAGTEIPTVFVEVLELCTSCSVAVETAAVRLTSGLGTDGTRQDTMHPTME